MTQYLCSTGNPFTTSSTSVTDPNLCPPGTTAFEILAPNAPSIVPGGDAINNVLNNIPGLGGILQGSRITSQQPGTPAKPTADWSGLASWLASSSNWKHLGILVGGAVLIVVGIAGLASDSPTVRTAAKLLPA